MFQITLPRILYIVAAIAWVILLWPNPVTIFLAGCFACLTLPFYKILRKKCLLYRRRIKKLAPSRRSRIMLTLAKITPVTTYTAFILTCFLLPIAALALLVSPQAVAGYSRLRELQASNFKLPPHWMEYFNDIKALLHEYPRLEKIINDGLANLDSMFGDAVGMLVSQGFGFLGSTMNVLWLLFLFLTLTVLFSVYYKVIKIIFSRILCLPHRVLNHLMISIRKALKAIALGICLVALVQGILCGVAFAFVGISQPAFWGLLATVVAPIPMVGTALVWGPLAISLWFGGNTMGAIGLVLWGALFVAGVDNVLRPFFLRQGIEASFFVLILSILCGLSVFGATGLIAGPVLLAIGMCAYQEGNYFFRKRV